MAKYSVTIKYEVLDEHEIEADSAEEAEDKIIEMANNMELSAGNIYGDTMEDIDWTNIVSTDKIV